jgi:hypothetical protein
MKIRSFEELVAPDELPLLFGPFGLGAVLSAEQATKLQQAAIARADLVDVVAESVRLSFERLRDLHTYGVLFPRRVHASYRSAVGRSRQPRR